jgi:hypothetical protein
VVERARTPGNAMLFTIFGAPIAGALNGALAVTLASLDFRPHHAMAFRHLGASIIGAGFLGALISVFFVLPLAFVTRAANGVHARIASIAWDSQRRRVFRVAATASIVAACLVPSARVGFPIFACVALAITLVLIAITDWDALRSLVTVDDRFEKHAPRSGESIVDLGVGDELWARPSSTETYRGDTAPFVVWGDAATARVILRESSRAAILCAALGLACVALRVLFT